MENIPSANTTTEPNWPELRQERRAIVVVDVVESVRLMQANEADFIDRWRRFVNEVRTHVLARHGGRLVKSLGDGLLLEFEAVHSAVAAALDIQGRIAPYNANRDVYANMALRAGVHVSTVVVDDLDIYGAGVNLAARLATLGHGGDVVVSTEVRDEVVDGLDAEVEDLGECYLKHLQEPVRAYRVGAPSARQRGVDEGQRPPTPRPTVAVLPFRCIAGDNHARIVAEALSAEIISGLSGVIELNVISRLSTIAFRDRTASLAEIAEHLGAGYVMSGSILLENRRLRLVVELADATSGSVVWADSLIEDENAMFSPEHELVATVVARAGSAVAQNEMRRTVSRPLPTLQSYSLMLGAIGLMHRSSKADFDRSRAMLQHLVDREPRHARPHAWLANWHALRVTQSQSPAPREDAQRALNCAGRALDLDPRCSLALAIDGVLQINLAKDLGLAAARFDSAIEANPNESLAWLFKGLMHGFKGEGPEAASASERALSLSLLDPLRYYYDTLAASAALGAGNYARTIELAQRSLRANRTHPSTYRALAIAQAMVGDVVAAASTVQQLRALTPSYTARDFKTLSGFSLGPLKDTFADALCAAGLPA